MSAFRSVCCTGGSNVPVAHEPDAVSFAVAGEANRRCRIVCLEGASDRDLQRAFRLAVSWPISWIEVMGIPAPLRCDGLTREATSVCLGSLLDKMKVGLAGPGKNLGVEWIRVASN